MNTEILPGRYRHYKGREYDLLAHATHTETGEAMVVYRACGGNGRAWVRPLSMFVESVGWEGAIVPRFTPIAAHNTVAAAARDHAAVVAERDRAVRALKRAGYTDTGGAEWRPPLGPNASPLLDEINALRAQVVQLREAGRRLSDEVMAQCFGEYLAVDTDAALRQMASVLAATAPKEADRG